MFYYKLVASRIKVLLALIIIPIRQPKELYIENTIGIQGFFTENMIFSFKRQKVPLYVFDSLSYINVS